MDGLRADPGTECNKPFGKETGSRGEGNPRPHRTVDNLEPLAVELADRLGDWKSLRFFRLVARRLPECDVRAALAVALEVPTADVRRSRAAIFTSLVIGRLERRTPRLRPRAP